MGARKGRVSNPDRTIERVEALIVERSLASVDNPVVLMVSGGSDSTALAYIGADLRNRGALGFVSMLHVNHKLRGEASDADAAFVESLAKALDIPLFACEIDMPALMREGGNMESVARRERYAAARDAVESTCRHLGVPADTGVVFTAHTADDRAENFYMRSIVGTGPGGLRAMKHASFVQGVDVRRPLLELSRDDLRSYIESLPTGRVATDAAGARWREDATNADTDRFRAFVRHEIVARAKNRNPRLLETLTRTMNLIADEDDLLEARANEILLREAAPLGTSREEGFLIAPAAAEVETPLLRRLIYRTIALMLPPEERVDSVSIDACLDAFGRSGAVANIQNDIAVSYNKQGLRLEPMAAFRARRKK